MVHTYVRRVMHDRSHVIWHTKGDCPLLDELTRKDPYVFIEDLDVLVPVGSLLFVPQSMTNFVHDGSKL